jgi:Major Facilitator Superfamily
MTCEAYYETHSEPAPKPGADRCSNREIEAGTSRAVALLGFSTTAFGVVNLFITGWTIKKLGIKSALLIQVFWPAVRLAIQNVGVMTGGGNGIIIIQCSQIITIFGGPSGYLLSLNSFIAEITENRERTGALGRLQGCSMFGMAFGYLLGGLLSDKFGIIAPFRITLALFLSSSLYVLLFLPKLPKTTAAATQSSTGFARFFGPLKTFAPRKWVLRNGRVQKQYGPLLLGIGVFLGVLATGYIPVLLQMYSTEAFQFGTTENGYLISLHSLVRGLFLTLAFPKIISAGREWVSDSKKSKDCLSLSQNTPSPEYPPAAAAVQAMENDEEPLVQPKRDDEEETFAFDLVFTEYSLIADGILTGAASFAAQGWQLYLIAMLLPFASGTGAAAKGTILQMCSTAERADALSGIAFVGMMARLSTSRSHL